MINDSKSPISDDNDNTKHLRPQTRSTVCSNQSPTPKKRNREQDNPIIDESESQPHAKRQKKLTSAPQNNADTIPTSPTKITTWMKQRASTYTQESTSIVPRLAQLTQPPAPTSSESSTSIEESIGLLQQDASEGNVRAFAQHCLEIHQVLLHAIEHMGAEYAVWFLPVVVCALSSSPRACATQCEALLSELEKALHNAFSEQSSASALIHHMLGVCVQQKKLGELLCAATQQVCWPETSSWKQQHAKAAMAPFVTHCFLIHISLNLAPTIGGAPPPEGMACATPAFISRFGSVQQATRNPKQWAWWLREQWISQAQCPPLHVLFAYVVHTILALRVLIWPEIVDQLLDLCFVWVDQKARKWSLANVVSRYDGTKTAAQFLEAAVAVLTLVQPQHCQDPDALTTCAATAIVRAFDLQGTPDQVSVVVATTTQQVVSAWQRSSCWSVSKLTRPIFAAVVSAALRLNHEPEPVVERFFARLTSTPDLVQSWCTEVLTNNTLLPKLTPGFVSTLLERVCSTEATALYLEQLWRVKIVAAEEEACLCATRTVLQAYLTHLHRGDATCTHNSSGNDTASISAALVLPLVSMVHGLASACNEHALTGRGGPASHCFALLCGAVLDSDTTSSLLPTTNPQYDEILANCQLRFESAFSGTNETHMFFSDLFSADLDSVVHLVHAAEATHVAERKPLPPLYITFSRAVGVELVKCFAPAPPLQPAVCADCLLNAFVRCGPPASAMFVSCAAFALELLLGWMQQNNHFRLPDCVASVHSIVDAVDRSGFSDPVLEQLAIRRRVHALKEHVKSTTARLALSSLPLPHLNMSELNFLSSEAGAQLARFERISDRVLSSVTTDVPPPKAAKFPSYEQVLSLAARCAETEFRIQKLPCVVAFLEQHGFPQPPALANHPHHPQYLDDMETWWIDTVGKLSVKQHDLAVLCKLVGGDGSRLFVSRMDEFQQGRWGGIAQNFDMVFSVTMRWLRQLVDNSNLPLSTITPAHACLITEIAQHSPEGLQREFEVLVGALALFQQRTAQQNVEDAAESMARLVAAVQALQYRDRLPQFLSTIQTLQLLPASELASIAKHPALTTRLNSPALLLHEAPQAVADAKGALSGLAPWALNLVAALAKATATKTLCRLSDGEFHALRQQGLTRADGNATAVALLTKLAALRQFMRPLWQGSVRTVEQLAQHVATDRYKPPQPEVQDSPVLGDICAVLDSWAVVELYLGSLCQGAAAEEVVEFVRALVQHGRFVSVVCPRDECGLGFVFVQQSTGESHALRPEDLQEHLQNALLFESLVSDHAQKAVIHQFIDAYELALKIHGVRQKQFATPGQSVDASVWRHQLMVDPAALRRELAGLDVQTTVAALVVTTPNNRTTGTHTNDNCTATPHHHSNSSSQTASPTNTTTATAAMASPPPSRTPTPTNEALNEALLSMYRIDPSQVHVDTSEVLGRGAFGDVVKGTLHGASVAVKKFHAKLNKRDIKAVETEALMMARVCSPYCVRLLGFSTEPNLAMLVLEYVPNGSLYDFLADRNGEITAHQRLQLALDVAVGVHHIHMQNMVHGDLKSANVLVSSELRAKVTDFGLSRFVSIASRRTATASALGGCGTLRWRAPELLGTRSPNTQQADIFALGVVLWEILTAEVPYEDLEEFQIADAVRNGHRPKIPNPQQTFPWANAFVELLSKCWANDPSSRPNSHVVSTELRKLLDANPRPAFDVFLSHNWGKDALGRDNHARVGVLKRKLEENGLRVWYDEQRMRGSISVAMADGIESSKIVIICVTSNYISKCKNADDNCHCEFNFALDHHTAKNVVFAVMESVAKDSRSWTGPVGLRGSSQLYYDCSMDENSREFGEGVGRLAGEVRKRISQMM